MERMFKYRAMSKSGTVVAGTIAAGTSVEALRQVERSGLYPIEARPEETQRYWNLRFSLTRKCRPEDVTFFTQDLALLLRAGVRLDAALELLAKDMKSSALGSVVAALREAVLAGKSLSRALAAHPEAFPPTYVALVRIGELSGALDRILETLAVERGRAEKWRRMLQSALRYPVFVLFASLAVLTFFVAFVLPQFSFVLRDLPGSSATTLSFFIGVAEWINSSMSELAVLGGVGLLGLIYLGRTAWFRSATLKWALKMPGLRGTLQSYRAVMFCRNLSILLTGGVPLSSCLRTLEEMRVLDGADFEMRALSDRVRQGARLTDVLVEMKLLPDPAIRLLRLGEESGELASLAGRVADYFETRLQRNLEHISELVGPVTVIAISVVVGTLVISIMTALLSITQLAI
jgi:general secretion pathway protein F